MLQQKCDFFPPTSLWQATVQFGVSPQDIFFYFLFSWLEGLLFSPTLLEYQYELESVI
jgi:hypothetical protein